MIIDITADETPAYQSDLDWVGMRGVEIPVKFNGTLAPAKSNILVNLINKNRKGIHMSRLYLIAKEQLSANKLSAETLKRITSECIESHTGLSDEAKIAVSFEYLREFPSLLSDNAGWRYYPVTFTCSQKGDTPSFEVEFELTYSSTCPCSGALSRQSFKDHFERSFPGDTIERAEVSEWLMQEKNQTATPHSQRSHASIKLQMDAFDDFTTLEAMIKAGEEALQTAVQTAVKRIDEQRFAELNAQNMMFCEDAARRLQHTYDGIAGINDYRIEVRHLESLHAHDAMAIVTKH